VEEALLLHPDVAEVAVVGRVHGDWGEEVVACIVARDGATAGDEVRKLERALDAWCLDRIARFKRPKAYVFSPSCRRTIREGAKTELRLGFSRAAPLKPFQGLRGGRR
jgi:long-chain acyl-CoA synthetase